MSSNASTVRRRRRDSSEQVVDARPLFASLEPLYGLANLRLVEEHAFTITKQIVGQTLRERVIGFREVAFEPAFEFLTKFRAVSTSASE